MNSEDLALLLGVLGGGFLGHHGGKKRAAREKDMLELMLGGGKDETDEEPEESENIVYDPEGTAVDKGEPGLFNFSGYHDPIHDLITVGDDPESFSNNLSDFLIGLEKPQYNEEGELIKGDPNENWFNTMGALPYLMMMKGGIPGLIAGGTGLGYQGMSSFAPEFTQKWVDKPIGQGWDWTKNKTIQGWNNLMNYEGFNQGGIVDLYKRMNRG